MKNLIQDGTRMRYTAAADIASGAMVKVGSRVGVATADIANGDTGELAMEGVYEIKKKTADNLTQGLPVYWDDTNKEITLTSSGNTLAGYTCNTNAGAGNIYVKINA